MSKVGRMFADSKYHNHSLYEWVDANASWRVVVVRRPEGKKGWVRLPIRWTVAGGRLATEVASCSA